jgi:hypothetical protein
MGKGKIPARSLRFFGQGLQEKGWRLEAEGWGQKAFAPHCYWPSAPHFELQPEPCQSSS